MCRRASTPRFLRIYMKRLLFFFFFLPSFLLPPLYDTKYLRPCTLLCTASANTLIIDRSVADHSLLISYILILSKQPRSFHKSLFPCNWCCRYRSPQSHSRYPSLQKIMSSLFRGDMADSPVTYLLEGLFPNQFRYLTGRPKYVGNFGAVDSLFVLLVEY